MFFSIGVAVGASEKFLSRTIFHCKGEKNDIYLRRGVSHFPKLVFTYTFCSSSPICRLNPSYYNSRLYRGIQPPLDLHSTTFLCLSLTIPFSSDNLSSFSHPNNWPILALKPLDNFLHPNKKQTKKQKPPLPSLFKL